MILSKCTASQSTAVQRSAWQSRAIRVESWQQGFSRSVFTSIAGQCRAANRRARHRKATRIGLMQMSHFRASLVQAHSTAGHCKAAHSSAQQRKATRIGHSQSGTSESFWFKCRARQGIAWQRIASQSISDCPSATVGFPRCFHLKCNAMHRTEAQSRARHRKATR